MENSFCAERIENSFSSIYHCWLFHSADTIPGSLFNALRVGLPHLPHEEIPERVRWGGVFVNGIEVNDEMDLPTPCKLEYYEPRFRIADAASYFPAFSTDHILFEDEFLIALFKPAKLPTNPGKEQKYYNVKAYVERHVAGAVHLPSRLDMSTCGVILISKNQCSHKPLQRLYEYGAVKKVYLLGTAEHMDWETHDHQGAIGKDMRHAVLRKVVSEGGKSARTVFTKLAERPHPLTGSPTTYLKAEPHTGRTHQIRVHSSNLGIPIIGDNFYGGAHSQNLHLMAYSVAFRHPKGGAPVSIEVPQRLFPNWLPHDII